MTILLPFFTSCKLVAALLLLSSSLLLLSSSLSLLSSWWLFSLYHSMNDPILKSLRMKPSLSSRDAAASTPCLLLAAVYFLSYVSFILCMNRSSNFFPFLALSKWTLTMQPLKPSSLSLTSFGLSHYVFRCNVVLVLALPLHVHSVAVGRCSP